MLTGKTRSVDSKLVEDQRGGGQAHPFSSDGAIRPKLQSPLAARCQSVIMPLWRQFSIQIVLPCTAVCFLCAELACGWEEAGTGERWCTLQSAHNENLTSTLHVTKCAKGVHKLPLCNRNRGPLVHTTICTQ